MIALSVARSTALVGKRQLQRLLQARQRIAKRESVAVERRRVLLEIPAQRQQLAFPFSAEVGAHMLR